MAQCCRIGCWKLYCTVCRTILIELQWWTWIIPLPYWEVFCVRCNVWNVFIVLWPFGVVAQNKALFCIPTQNFIHVRVVSKQNKTAPIALDMTYCMLELKVPRPRKNTSCRFSFFFSFLNWYFFHYLTTALQNMHCATQSNVFVVHYHPLQVIFVTTTTTIQPPTAPVNWIRPTLDFRKAIFAVHSWLME